MMAQKFHRGDLVHVTVDLGPMMSHFPADSDALIIGSYADIYGGSDTDDYQLLFTDDGSRVAWYYTHQLTFIRHAGESAIAEVEQKRSEADNLHSSLDWIIANWKSEKLTGRSIQALADACGFGSLWGESGEGVIWYRNASIFIDLFDAVMKSGNRRLVEQKIEAVKSWLKEKKCK